MPVTPESLKAATASWGSKHREQIEKMSAKYGMPTDVSPNMVAWHDAGPFKCISISKEAVQHNFPMTHPDFLQHTVRYKIPADKASDLIASDGSVTVDRTGGTLSAKCDTEPHTLLGLNLAHDIITGKKSVREARDEHARIAMEEKAGRSHPYLEELQFQPAGEDAADPDQPHNPGKEGRTRDDGSQPNGMTPKNPANPSTTPTSPRNPTNPTGPR